MTLVLWVVLGIVLLFGFVVFRGAPYVPTKRKMLDKAFDTLYPLTENDVLVDIGSGDGVVLRAAAQRGAKAIGYELNPLLVVVSRLLSRSSLVRVRFADFWLAELPKETTVIYTFGEARDIKRMYEKAEQTAALRKRGLYFISFGFEVPGIKYAKYDGSFYLYKISPRLIR